jgi:hypothetical protein
LPVRIGSGPSFLWISMRGGSRVKKINDPRQS